MKRQFLALPLLFFLFSFLFLLPTQVRADTCASQNGYCALLTCGVENGNPVSPLPNTSCWPGFLCCLKPVTPPADDHQRFCPPPGDPNGPHDPVNGVNTALGCIKIGSGQDLVVTILRLATGLGGGLALALILYGVFIVTTSAGMPDKLKAGSEIITSAVIGLVFILLSVFLVNLIGINILGIPGLS